MDLKAQVPTGCNSTKSTSKTVVTSLNKVYCNASNDLSLQLRKRGVVQVILARMSANLCTESHMRELIEQGFEVAVFRNATAAPKLRHRECRNQEFQSDICGDASAI